MNRMNTLGKGTLPIERGTGPNDAFARRYQQQGSAGGSSGTNVGETERALSVAAGVLLIGGGLYRGTTGGLLAAVAGAAVAYRGVSGHCAVYDSLGIDTANESQSGRREKTYVAEDGHRFTGRHQGGSRLRGKGRPDPQKLYEKGMSVDQSVTVMKPRQELFDYWHDLTNMPKFMPHVDRVEMQPDGKSVWHCKGPGGLKYSYLAETIADKDGSTISWQSVDSDETRDFGIDHAGTARFTDAPPLYPNSTVVRLEVRYLPPAGFAGRFGVKIARLLGQAPETDVRASLRKFKQLMEAGEVTTNAGSPTG